VDSLSTIGPDSAAPYKHNSPGVCNFEEWTPTLTTILSLPLFL
jgi:hypothetical protein